MVYDTIVVGRGPAGISAAIYLKRYNLNPLVIAYDNGALTNAHKIDNYYGRPGLTGNELAEEGINQAKELGIEFVDSEVVSIEFLDNFKVKTSKEEFEAKTIFLAMGKKKTILPIKEGTKFDGKGVSYCAICDGFFFRNKKIGIVGSGLFMQNELDVLKNFSDDITIFTNGEKLESLESTKVVEDKIVSLLGEERLTGVKTEKSSYDLDALFIALGTQSGMSIALHLGLELDDKGFLVVNKDMMTNLPGVFAGGDVTGGLLQVSKAVSDGANAALGIKNFIEKR